MDGNQKEKLFIELKDILQKYQGEFTNKTNDNNNYDLWTKTSVTINGKTLPSINYATIKINKNFVGFYFMPIYIEPLLKQKLNPNLLNLLKGKNCFHIKILNGDLNLAIKQALQIGYNFYKQKEFV